MSDGTADCSRRGFLRAAAGASAASAAVGTAAAQENGSSGGGGAPPDYGTWFSDVSNYDGSTVDMRGQEEVTVMVGTEGNNGPNAFDPPAIHVDAGTTVLFEWTGEGSHNVVSQGDDWTSGSTTGSAGVNYERTFDQTGIHKYYCQPHLSLGMKGAIVVGDEYPTVAPAGGGGPQVPPMAKSLGIAASVVMTATLGLAYVFIKYGGDYDEPGAD